MKKRIITAAVLLATLTLLFASVLSVSAESGGALPKYDYTHRGSEVNKTAQTDSVVAEYLSSKDMLSDAEREFLSLFGNISVSYSDLISSDRVTVENTEGGITVKAEKYEYTAKSGTLTYVPVSAEISGERVAIFESGECFFEGADATDSALTVTVHYEADVRILNEDMSIALNLYHDTASLIYEEAEFERAETLYNEYKRAKRIYDDAERKYLQYLDRLSEYEADVQRYEAYEAALIKYAEDYSRYLEYLTAMDKYDIENAEYLRYLADMETVSRQLAAVELVKVEMTDERTLYGAVMGGTVDEVLGNKSLLTGILEVDASLVDRAGAATERVRALMKSYYELEDTSDRYNYYVVNYDSFRESFRELTVTLDALYRYPRVRGTLIAEGKDKKYIILVAQLALVTNALTDGAVKDLNGKPSYGDAWKIESKTIKQILGEEYFTDTDNAKPLSSGYPLPKEEPIKPDTVEKPTQPTEPKLPVPPSEVANPGEPPEEVIAPTAPVPANRFVADIAARLDSVWRARLLSAYTDKLTVRREAPEKTFIYKIKSEVKRTPTAPTVHLTFIDTDGERLYSVEIEKGSSISFEGTPPVRPDDEFGSYKFIGWQNKLGERVSLLGINESVELYPAFERNPTYYSVSWRVMDKTVTETHVSDIIPVCPISTEVADEGSFFYEFVGWDKEVVPLSEDVTYTAVYEKRHIVSFEGGGAMLYDDGATVTADAYNNASGITDISKLLPRIAAQRDLILMLPVGEVAFSFSDVIEMKELGACKIKTEFYQIGAAECRYAVYLYDGNGSSVGENICPDVQFACGLRGIETARMFTNTEDGVKYVPFEVRGGAVSATLNCGAVYSILLEYRISISESNEAQISTDKAAARPGERVSLSVIARDGIEISEIIILDANGNRISIERDGSFRMPNSNVNIAVKTVRRSYTVTFIASGKTVAVFRVPHGESIEPPRAPRIESDNLYSYEFIEWYPVGSVITGDVTYTAVYRRTLLPIKETENDIGITPSVMRYVVLLAVSVSLFALGIIPASVIAAVYTHRAKKCFSRAKFTKKGKKA